MNPDPRAAGGAGQPGPAPRQHRPPRRAVLLAAAAVGGAAAIGGVIEATRSAPSHGPGGRSGAAGPGPARSGGAHSGGGHPARSAGPAPSDWASLSGELSPAVLIRPGEQGYSRARRLFDPRFDYLRPAGVAYCRTPADVSTCLAFARRFGVPVAARSGGHSYAGWSSTTGLIIDVTQLASFAAGSSTVQVGTGIQIGRAHV